MQKYGIRHGRQRWQCRVRQNKRMQDWYDGLTGVEFNSLLLRRRRVKALRRRRERGG